MAANGIQVQRLAIPRHQVSDQLLRPGRDFADGRRRRQNSRAVHQRRLHLGQLDAEAPELDLRIDPPAELDFAVSGPGAQVAGAVQAPHAARGKRVGHEILGIEFRARDVTARHARAADVQLAGLAGGNRAEAIVENVHLIVGDGPADGDAPAGVKLATGGDHRCLGGAVGVDHPQSRPVPAPHQVRRARFAAEDQEAQGRHVGAHHRQERGHAGENGDAGIRQDRRQGWARTHDLLRSHDKGRPVGQREPDFFHGRVEGDRETLEDAVGGENTEEPGLGADQVRGAAVIDGDALGPAGGAGRVDDVAGIALRGAGVVPGQPMRRLAGNLRRVGIEQDDVPARGRVRPGKFGRGDQRVDIAVPQDICDPARRVLRVKRDISCPRLQDRQQGHIDIARSRQQDRDPLFRLCTGRPQIPGQPVGAPVEFPVADHIRAEHQRRAFGMELHLSLEQLVKELVAQESRVSGPGGPRRRHHPFVLRG